MRRKQIFALCRVVFYALIFIALIALPTSFFEERSFCIYYNLFGVKCIGCGTTRAVANLLHGNFARAIEFNSLAIYVFLPLFGGFFLQDCYCVIRRILYKDYNKNSWLEKILGLRGKATVDLGEDIHEK